MDNKNNQQEETTDFTGKGRTSNPEGGHEEESGDISNIDQQEGELNHGTTGKDEALFSPDKKDDASS